MLTKSKNLCTVELPARLASTKSNYEANCLNRREIFLGVSVFEISKRETPQNVDQI